MPDAATPAPCPMTDDGVRCTGNVYPVDLATDIGDGVWKGYSVCDTCQARFDVTFYEDDRRPEIVITTGRARGLQDYEKTFMTFPGEDAE